MSGSNVEETKPRLVIIRSTEFRFMLLVAVISMIVEYHYFSAIYQIYWNSILPEGLLTFSGVILGLSFVALPVASTMFEKEVHQKYDYKLLLRQMKLISSLGVITIQASGIAFLNIVSYFFRYDGFGVVTVFLEVLILPSFFIIVLISVYRFWGAVMLSAYNSMQLVKVNFSKSKLDQEENDS